MIATTLSLVASCNLKTASCDAIAEYGWCREYDKPSARAEGRTMCQEKADGEQGGVWREAPCPTDGVVGKCRLPNGGLHFCYGRGASMMGPDRCREVCASLHGTPE